LVGDSNSTEHLDASAIPNRDSFLLKKGEKGEQKGSKRRRTTRKNVDRSALD